MKTRLLVIIFVVTMCFLIGTLRAVTRRQNDPHNNHMGAHQKKRHLGTITGRVLNSDNEPVSQVTVHAEKDDFQKGIMPSSITSAEGSFVLTGLVPGTYKVYASKDEDGHPSPVATFYTSGSDAIQKVNVSDGQTISNLTVRLSPKAAKLTGKIIDAYTKKPIKDAQITLRRIDNPNFFIQTGPDEKGGFEILVPTVPFTIEVAAMGYEKKVPASLQLEKGGIKRLNISLRPAK